MFCLLCNSPLELCSYKKINIIFSPIHTPSARLYDNNFVFQRISCAFIPPSFLSQYLSRPQILWFGKDISEVHVLNEGLHS